MPRPAPSTSPPPPFPPRSTARRATNSHPINRYFCAPQDGWMDGWMDAQRTCLTASVETCMHCTHSLAYVHGSTAFRRIMEHCCSLARVRSMCGGHGGASGGGCFSGISTPVSFLFLPPRFASSGRPEQTDGRPASPAQPSRRQEKKKKTKQNKTKRRENKTKEKKRKEKETERIPSNPNANSIALVDSTPLLAFHNPTTTCRQSRRSRSRSTHGRSACVSLSSRRRFLQGCAYEERDDA